MSVLDRIRLSDADITTLQVDAIVNAANAALCGGGGVDGAIHAAAGPELLDECRTIGRCPPGEAVVTAGHHLPAKWVIHAVGPVWSGGSNGEAETLRRTYAASLSHARDLGAKTVAFPAISCGAYRFPIPQAADIAVREVARFMRPKEPPTVVTLCCFDPSVYRAYARVLRDMEAEI